MCRVEAEARGLTCVTGSGPPGGEPKLAGQLPSLSAAARTGLGYDSPQLPVEENFIGSRGGGKVWAWVARRASRKVISRKMCCLFVVVSAPCSLACTSPRVGPSSPEVLKVLQCEGYSTGPGNPSWGIKKTN